MTDVMKENSKNLLLSVIVPVYNAEPYLRKCLDSIVQQTYQNLEIILLIDGGSTDRSAEICEEYAAEDARIKLLYRPHEGLVSARKAGVSAASGEYIAYVDSDDWIDLDAYERLFAAIEDTYPDVLIYGFLEEHGDFAIACQSNVPVGYYSDSEIKENIYPHFWGMQYSKRTKISCGSRLDSAADFHQYSEEWSLQSEIYPSVWSKMVKRTVLQKSQLMVPEKVTIGEDLVCGGYTLFMAKSLSIVNIAPYHYLVRSSSASRSVSLEEYRRLFSAIRNLFSKQDKADMYMDQLSRLLMNYVLLGWYELFLEDEFADILFGKLNGCRLALYGAGKFGKEIYQKTMARFPDSITVWVDKNYIKYQKTQLPVKPVEVLLTQDYDRVIIALSDEKICEEIKNNLIGMGIAADKIRYVSATPKVLDAVKKILGKTN